MSFVPTSLREYIAHFENSFNGSNPFYYEASTTTINFGFGLNLTAAQDAALNGNGTIKGLINSWLGSHKAPEISKYSFQIYSSRCNINATAS